MERKRLLWLFLPSHVILAVAALLTAYLFGLRTLRETRADALAARLEAQARVAVDLWREARDGETDAIADRRGEAALLRLRERYGVHVVILNPKEEPVAGDPVDRKDALGLLARPEVQTALRADRTALVRTNLRSQARPRPGLAVALVWRERERKFLVYAHAEMPARLLASPALLDLILGEGLLVIGVAVLGACWLSLRVSGPISRLRLLAERLTEGNLGSRLPIQDYAVLGGAAQALNGMAERVEERFQSIVDQRNQQLSILRSMREGVLAYNNDETIIALNSRARELFGVTMASVQGRAIQEVLRNSTIQTFAQRALRSETTIEDEIVLHLNERERFIQVQGMKLVDTLGNAMGGLVVLNEITQIRRLEMVRRDFVANVSHELRTPITSIKGFAETLLDGAMSDPEDAARFLHTILRQADRLNAIIGDLLSLSSIEQEVDKTGLHLEMGSVGEVLRAVLQACSKQAQDRGVTVEVQCPESLRAPMNMPLLEQAVINLVDNAIKYSPEGERVRMVAEANGQSIEIAVVDRGCGIPQEHHERLFERFYRVDKARSRKLGGTGLGLSIVKHIVRAHQGDIHVDSEPGQGSCFVIRLPKTQVVVANHA